MLVLEKEDAAELIEPFRDRLLEAVGEAFKDFMATGFNRGLQHPTVRAMMIWNQILRRAEQSIPPGEGFRIESRGSNKGFVIGDRAFIKVKQAPDGQYSRNYRTRSAVAFFDQTQDLFGGVARLELLYTLDDLKTKVEKVQLAQRHKSKVLWSVDLQSGPSADAQTPIPFEPNAPSGTPGERLIKPKKSGEDDATGTRSGGG